VIPTELAWLFWDVDPVQIDSDPDPVFRNAAYAMAPTVPPHYRLPARPAAWSTSATLFLSLMRNTCFFHLCAPSLPTYIDDEASTPARFGQVKQLYFHGLVDAAGDVIGVFDREQHYVYVNPEQPGSGSQAAGDAASPAGAGQAMSAFGLSAQEQGAGS
jgi:PAS domain-containing protein